MFRVSFILNFRIAARSLYIGAFFLAFIALGCVPVGNNTVARDIAGTARPYSPHFLATPIIGPPEPVLSSVPSTGRNTSEQKGELIALTWNIDGKWTSYDPAPNVTWPTPLVVEGTKDVMVTINAMPPDVAIVQVFDSVGPDGFPTTAPVFECTTTLAESDDGCVVLGRGLDSQLLFAFPQKNGRYFITIWAGWHNTESTAMSEPQPLMSAASWIFSACRRCEFVTQ